MELLVGRPFACIRLTFKFSTCSWLVVSISILESIDVISLVSFSNGVEDVVDGKEVCS
jgi:hypothetical protein